MTEMIPWAISGISMVVCVLTYLRNGKAAEIKERTENDARLEGLREALLKANIKLDQVCAVTNETRSDIKALNSSIVEMDKRLSVVENDLKTAFMRIDELRETKMNK